MKIGKYLSKPFYGHFYLIFVFVYSYIITLNYLLIGGGWGPIDSFMVVVTSVSYYILYAGGFFVLGWIQRRPFREISVYMVTAIFIWIVLSYPPCYTLLRILHELILHTWKDKAVTWSITYFTFLLLYIWGWRSSLQMEKRN